jgi:undecaprenyl-diphosphatase
VITIAPGLGLWDLAEHVSWLAGVLIVVTKGCAVLIPVALLAAWFWPAGLRCLLAAVLALFLVIVVREAIAGAWYLPRPFIAYHFQPLYPHAPDSAFPSLTTSYFTAAGYPAWRTWRPLGWLFAAMTAEVGFGCVYVGVHYATDVLAGAAIGAGCGLVAWLVFGWRPIAWLLGQADRGLAAVRLRRRIARPPEPAVG